MEKMKYDRIEMRATKYDPRSRALLSVVLSLALIGGFVLVTVAFSVTVGASTATVSTSWNIPVDKAISISYPTGNVAVLFHPASSTFAQLWANGQGNGSLAAFRVTNIGNTAVGLSGAFDAFPSGVAEFRIANASSAGNPSTGQIWWCGTTTDTGQSPAGSCSGSSNVTTSRQMMAAGALAAAATHDWWAWSWGTAVVPGTTTKTLTITSA